MKTLGFMMDEQPMMEDQPLPPNSRVRLLVVDDREDNLLSIETILAGGDYELVKATSGRAALKILLADHDFSLILMDVQMPGMSGFETAALIFEREKVRHIPIIFITANSKDEANLFEGYRTGGVDFIYKPIHPQLLRYKVSIFAELFRKNQQLQAQEKTLREMNHQLAAEIDERRANEDKMSRLNVQLMQNNRHLKTINDELDRFAYVASHDLQEPLRKILVFSEMLDSHTRGQQDPKVQDYMSKIRRASNRMKNLIHDLLTFSRQGAAPGKPMQAVSLNDVLKDALTDLPSPKGQPSIMLQAPDLPVVKGYPSQLAQLFQNLLTNAVKFAHPSRALEVQIALRQVAGAEAGLANDLAQQHFTEIEVRDNGIGFEEDFNKEIFDVFRRLHSHSEIEGTGIGLSICKKIMEAHHGFIRAEGRPGQGASFFLYFPDMDKMEQANGKQLAAAASALTA